MATLPIPSQRKTQKFMSAVVPVGLSADVQAFIVCGTRTFALYELRRNDLAKLF